MASTAHPTALFAWRVLRYLIALVALSGALPVTAAGAQLLGPKRAPAVSPAPAPAAAMTPVTAATAPPARATPITTAPRSSAVTTPVRVATTTFDLGTAFAANVELAPVLSARRGGGISPFFVLLSLSGFAMGFALLGRQWRASRPTAIATDQ